ncbi:DUF937 domain-containing protein [Microseira wollei]|uniref:DUF937 domain-containing protein n=1 Tax=Microseira wollei NIES-4236 TaxID=2530354 RepID=A0AAV3WGH1_9CYAN|nr:DUF937 domain-containing protein [Microseira wollei]GET37494.1 hypothetical protein MiSe_22470 [Microseira wollei NIES-4236]
MGLFDQIMNAVNDPNLQANAGQLAGIFGTMQQLGNNQGADASTMQSAMSVVGGFVRSALQEKQAEGGNDAVQNLVNQFGGTSPNIAAVTALFGSQLQPIIEAVAQRTGLDPNTIQQMLPTLVPLVLNFLKTGAPTQDQAGANPVLNSFLDADGDGDVDIADAMRMAGGFLGQ